MSNIALGRERTMADIRNFIGFAQTETLIKEYDGLRMYYPVRAKIALAATNKRFIVYSTVRNFFGSKAESLFQQVDIADIKGLGIVQSQRYRPGIAAFGIVMLAAGIVVSVIGLTGNSLFLSAGIGVAITGVLLGCAGIFWKKNLFRFEVLGNAWILNIGEFENIRPQIIAGPDLLKIVEELGAIVIEIKEGTLYSAE